MAAEPSSIMKSRERRRAFSQILVVHDATTSALTEALEIGDFLGRSSIQKHQHLNSGDFGNALAICFRMVVLPVRRRHNQAAMPFQPASPDR
jgi:hypothetical protein